MPATRKTSKSRRPATAAKTAARPALKRVAKPVAKPAAKRVTKPVAKSVRKPATKPVNQPARAPRPATDRERIEQLSAEVAVINAVQQALAGERNIQSVYEAVGDKLQEVFPDAIVGIRIFDVEANLMHYPYLSLDGGHVAVDSGPPSGFGAEVIRTGKTILIDHNMDEASHRVGATSLVSGRSPKSQLMVPMFVNGQVRGMLTLNDTKREYAFSDSDVRLLETLAASMTAALENARLFDETQRLLKETEQRAAELTVINSIQKGMAEKLDFQAIVNLVGDKLRGVFHTGDIGIRWYDPKTNLNHFLYQYEHGVRLSQAPRPPSPGGLKTMQTREPVVVNNPADYAAQGFQALPGTDQSLSAVAVPILGSDRALGTIALENYERENAFGEAEIRLLTTVAASMGVALENARLFDETQRLLKETEQRNAELAIINSVQAALAAELDIQGIYDAVGDKIREIFHNADTGIRIYDPETDLIHFPYTHENGSRITIDSILLPEGGFGPHVLRTRETLVINEKMDEAIARYRSFTHPGTQTPKSAVYVPLVAGDQARGVINLMDMTRENAFGESDVRLLQTLANSMSVALENARLFDETQRLLKETEQRNAELAVINSVQAALAAELDIQGIYDAVGDKIREIFHEADIGIRIIDPDTEVIQFPYFFKDGKRLTIPTQPMGPSGMTRHVFSTREALVINEDMAGAIVKFGSYVSRPCAREIEHLCSAARG